MSKEDEKALIDIYRDMKKDIQKAIDILDNIDEDSNDILAYLEDLKEKYSDLEFTEEVKEKQISKFKTKINQELNKSFFQ